MKKKFFMLSLLFVFSSAAWAMDKADNNGDKYVDTLASNHPEYLPQIAVGTSAPEVSAPDTLGNVVSTADFKGKYVVVDFWATWCGDCRREMPGFKKLHDDFKNRKLNGKEVQFLSYSFDRDAEKWKTYIRNEKISWPQISTLQLKWHDIPVTKDYGISWIPAFLLISPDGKIAGKAITAEGLRQVLKDEAERLSDNND